MIEFEHDHGVARDFLKAVLEVDPTATADYLGYTAPVDEWVKDDDTLETVDVFDHFTMAQEPLICLRLRFRTRIDEDDDGFLDVVYGGERK